jgi:hypothetical protein
MIKMPLIAIDEQDKTDLDKIAVELAGSIGEKSVTYAYVVSELIKRYRGEKE